MEKNKTIQKALDTVFFILIFSFLFYQLYYIRSIPYEPTVHAIVHLGFAMFIGVIARLREATLTPGKSLYLIILLAASIWVTSYFFFNYKVILADPSYPPTIALVSGVIATLVAIILVRWSFGWLFPILSALAVLYVLYGKHLPGAWRAPSISPQRAITLLAADVTSPWGLYGNLLGISANYLFLFIIFGSILHAFGGLRFIIQLGTFAASKLKSGPAALAVISSALLGSITGSTAANITITGSFTIPLMKDAGYKPEQASAIESAASNGGQFLPPIMGATVFVMAAYTGIPYITIVKAALVPSLVYFFILFLYAELNARKLNITTMPAQLNITSLLFDAPIFIGPLLLLILLLIQGFSLMFVVFWSVIAVVVLGLLASIRKESRLEWAFIKDKLYAGVIMGSHVAIILAVIGVFVASIEVTGLSLKLSIILGQLAGDNLFLILIFTMLASLILGVGVPTPAAYVIVATVLSPLLIRQGLPVLQAHLFPLFYAFISHLTPPVGVGLIIACKIADSNYLRSAVEVFKAAFVSLLLPFFFIYSPAILLQYDNVFIATLQIAGALLIFFNLSVFFNNQWKFKLTYNERIFMLVASAFSIIFIFIHQHYLWILLSLVFCVIALGINSKRSMKNV